MSLAADEVMIDGEVRKIDHFIDPSITYVTSTDSKYTDWYEGGKILAFTEGTRSQFKILDLVSDDNNPTIFVNKGKVVVNTTASYGFSFNGCTNFRVLGSGDPDHYYGIEIEKTGTNASGIGCSSRSEKFEIANIHIHHIGFAGILAKTDGAIGWTLNNIWIHDCYIHDTHGEGMYIGETKTPSHEIHHVRVHNNLIHDTGWEGFQISNASQDVQVYNNTLYRMGIDNRLYQNKGFQTGDWTTGQFYNNIIMGATDNQLIALSSYDVSYTNNYIDGDGHANVGMCFTDNKSMSVEGSPILFDGNWFRDFPDFCFQVYNEVNATTISNNKWDANGSGAIFIKYGGGANESDVTLINNEETTVEKIQFVDVDAKDFRIVSGSFYADKNLGYESEGGTPPEPDPIPVPSNLTASAKSTSAIDLNWLVTSSGQVDFGVKISRSLNESTGYNEIYSSPISNTLVTSYTDNGLNANTTYYYKVRNYNNDGNSIYTNVANATTFDDVIPPEVPDAPSNLSATGVANTQISLIWSDNSDDETGFVIERSNNSSSGFVPVSNVGANVTQVADVGLIKNTTYYYRVKATNAVGSSTYSDVASGTTLDDSGGGDDIIYAVKFLYGTNRVFKGDVLGLEGQVPVGPDDVVVNGKVITNVVFVSSHASLTDAQNTATIQKSQSPEKFVWIDPNPTETNLIEV